MRRALVLLAVLLTCTLGALLALALVPAAIGAQACFRNTRPECEALWIAQFGLGAYLGGLSSEWAKTIATIDVAYLVRQGPRSAVGGGVLLGSNDVDGWVGAQARYRRWLSDRTSVDGALGVAMTGRSMKSPLLTAELGVNLRDRVSLYAQLQPIAEVQNTRPVTFSEHRLAPSVSARFGSTFGAGLVIVVSALLGLSWAVLAGS